MGNHAGIGFGAKLLKTLNFDNNFKAVVGLVAKPAKNAPAACMLNLGVLLLCRHRKMEFVSPRNVD
jgi:hypothetical protein